MNDLNRRGFLRLAGLGALGAGVVAAPPALAARFNRTEQIFRRTELMMGTYVTITVLDQSLDRAESAVASAFGEIARLEGLLTRFRKEAPLAHLAASGRLKDPSPEMVRVLEAAKHFYDLSHGRFDVTVAPLVDGVKAAFARTGQMPAETEMKRLRSLVDGRAVVFDQREVRLLREGMALTLDGLAKGYIVDRAAGVLKKAGLTMALVNAGGDIVAIGRKGVAPWRVAVLDPTKADHQGPVIPLENGAVATSGNYEVFYDQEKLHHHIVDPETGQSPAAPVSVSVKAADCLTADALSTTVFCLRPAQASRFLAGNRLEGLIILRSGQNISRGEWA